MQRLLPDAFGQALGAILAEQRKEWTRERERIEADAKALLAETRAELTTLIAALRTENAELRGKLEGDVAKRLSDLRDGKDGDPGQPGRDADDEAIIERILARLPEPEPGPAGKDADEEAIVERVLARLPAPEKGDPGDPETLLPIIERMIDDAVAAKPMPEPVPGPQGEQGDRGEPGPKGDDGERGEPGRDGRDGADVVDGFKSHDGRALLTLSSGKVIDLGVVQGKDGAPGRDGEPGKDGAPGRDGADGKDGLSFDAFELEPEYDGERTIRLRWKSANGKDQMREWRIPIVIDRGAYKPDVQFEAGDSVSYGGQIWIAQKSTTEKPGGNGDWRLAVRHGRDGKDGKDGAKGEQGPPGRPGRDLTLG